MVSVATLRSRLKRLEVTYAKNGGDELSRAVARLSPGVLIELASRTPTASARINELADALASQGDSSSDILLQVLRNIEPAGTA